MIWIRVKSINGLSGVLDRSDKKIDQIIVVLDLKG